MPRGRPPNDPQPPPDIEAGMNLLTPFDMPAASKSDTSSNQVAQLSLIVADLGMKLLTMSRIVSDTSHAGETTSNNLYTFIGHAEQALKDMTQIIIDVQSNQGSLSARLDQNEKYQRELENRLSKLLVELQSRLTPATATQPRPEVAQMQQVPQRGPLPPSPTAVPGAATTSIQGVPQLQATPFTRPTTYQGGPNAQARFPEARKP